MNKAFTEIACIKSVDQAILKHTVDLHISSTCDICKLPHPSEVIDHLDTCYSYSGLPIDNE